MQINMEERETKKKLESNRMKSPYTHRSRREVSVTEMNKKNTKENFFYHYKLSRTLHDDGGMVYVIQQFFKIIIDKNQNSKLP
jgi:Na+-transporting NADH:ubiquinone oxidoreductase subunit NqrF